MSQLIVDEIMLREPNLLVPGKKPVGSLKIDWNNKNTAHLVNLWGLGTNLGSCLKDRVGVAPGINGGLEIQRGSLYQPGSNQYATVGNVSTFGFHKNDRRWTAVIQLRFDDYNTDDFGVIVGSTISSASKGFCIWYENRTSQGSPHRLMQYMAPGTTGNSVSIAHNGFVSDSNLHTYVFRSDGAVAGDTGSLWIDGALVSTVDGTIETPSTTTTDMAYAARIGMAEQYPTLIMPMEIPLIAFFNEALSDGGCQSLSLDPYQFLIPA